MKRRAPAKSVRSRRRSEANVRIAPRIRVIHGRDVAIGPGKADLLEGVARAGSITAAANQLGMSYMRAWLLLKLMNQKFKEPVVRTARGGRRGGSASLTSTGRAALRLYRALEDETAILAGRFRRSFLRLLRP